VVAWDCHAQSPVELTVARHQTVVRLSRLNQRSVNLTPRFGKTDVPGFIPVGIPESGAVGFVLQWCVEPPELDWTSVQEKW
jgi:hypothetical protein